MKLSQQKRRLLLAAPVVVIAFLCLIFYLMRGGGGKRAGAAAMGLNTQLPKPRFDPRKAFLNKMQAYTEAERDSFKREQYEREDPYRVPDTVRTKNPERKRVSGSDQKADELLRQLDKLRESIHQPAGAAPVPPPLSRAPERVAASEDTAVNDPKVEQLNRLLDKVIRIQHPEEGKPAVAASSVRATDEVLPADPDVNTMSAVVTEDQVLTAGATLSLRLIDSIRVNGRVLPAGQLMYGTVNVVGERMQVHIGALRDGRNLYACDLQVYDLDGLAGIHIPGLLGREVAKQSADQGVNSLNVLNMDPSMAAQAASAGIQTMKAFASRKVRQVRVSVRAGYQVLLRPARMGEIENPTRKVEMVILKRRPPGFDPGGPIIERCRRDGMELSLRGIWLADSCLWFGLEWENHSPIVFAPAYCRWTIRDRRVFKRTAMQEWPLMPLSAPDLSVVGDDSVRRGWTGFRPFALAKGKELVVEVGEKGGGRVLQLVIHDRELIHAKKYEKETEP